MFSQYLTSVQPDKQKYQNYLQQCHLVMLSNIALLIKSKANKNPKEIVLCSQQVREGLRVITVYANYGASAEQAVLFPFFGTSDQEGSGTLWKISKGLTA